MRRTLGMLLLLVGLCSIVMERKYCNAQIQPDYDCSQIGISCGSCTNAGGGCWVWSGGPYYQCYENPNTNCDPMATFVACSAIWYFPSSCNGVNCQPNNCCSQNGKPMNGKMNKNPSCK